MNQHYELSLNDYVAIARRRWRWLAVPFIGISLVGALIALRMPPVYQSTGTILIESQQIPDELVRSTVTSYAVERIQVIQQRVMTRENLLRIIEKFNLFEDVREKLSVTEQIDLILSKIQIEKLAGNSSAAKAKAKARSQGAALISFTVSFEDRSPALAHAVANELVTLFLEENVKARTERASETTEFLAQETSKLKRELEIVEEQIALYKQENSNALPEHLDMHMKALERIEADIDEDDENIKEAEDEIRFLDVELAAINAGAVENKDQVATPEQSLAAAEAELASLKSRYSEKHPDIKRLQKQIDDLRAQVSDPASGNSTVSVQNIEVARVRVKITSARNRISTLQADRAQLEESRKEVKSIIVQAPQVQRGLVSLNRDYENTLAIYKELQGKEMGARLAESLEQDKKAERFTLIEPPIRPEKPVKPNRLQIMGIGVIIALMASLASTALLELSDRRIRGADALAALLNERPLVTIPYITTEDELQERRRARNKLIVAVAVVLVVVLLGVHFFYMPLNVFFYKVIVRLG